eukprot:TRINITY_DN24874_c1_g1_i1.p1 TRINITY_DN24874_c1_g1~~TRINITY_DN24874_c1_g1_i1.p1  ORF type:complete len:728 (+),score=149.29 TRINITY_DN24874_c1_g1_i1:68-2251(+)
MEEGKAKKCPVLSTFDGSSVLPFDSLRLTVECHINVAYIQYDVECTVSHAGDYILRVPLGRGSTVVAAYGASNEKVLYHSAVIPADKVEELGRAPEQSKTKYRDAPPIDRFFPDQFLFPIINVKKGRVQATVGMLQPMEFVEGEFEVSAPFIVPPECLPPNGKPETVCSIQCTLNTGTPFSQWSVTSHPMTVTREAPGFVDLHSVNSLVWAPSNFFIRYRIDAERIAATGFVEAKDGEDPSFAVFATPPRIGSSESYFGRKIIFLIDQSGSMYGEPFTQARQALLHGIDLLKPYDSFNVIFFNHVETKFSDHLMDASEANRSTAREWVRSQNCHGGTNIDRVMDVAAQMMASSPQDGRVPYIILLTDGADQNERSICMRQIASMSDVRVCTVGIGPYANYYFLKLLANVGHGFCDFVMHSDMVFKTISQLMVMAELPVLSGLVLEGPPQMQVSDLSVHDLYCGAPVRITGRFKGGIVPNEQLFLTGILPDGSAFRCPVEFRLSEHMPISLITAKDELDQLVAKAWLGQLPDAIENAINYSCERGIPCPYTVRICYVTDEKSKLDEEKKKKEKEKKKDKKPSATAVALVAGAIVGGFFLLGMTGPGFGDISASNANWFSGSAMFSSTETGLAHVASSIAQLVQVGQGTCMHCLQSCCQCLGEGGSKTVTCCGYVGDYCESCGSSVVRCVGSCKEVTGECLSGPCLDCLKIVFKVLGCLCEVVGQILGG